MTHPSLLYAVSSKRGRAVVLVPSPFRHFVSLAIAMAGRTHRVELQKTEMTAVNGKRGPTHAQEDAVSRRARRLQAFHPSYRRFVAELTACASELEDLADSFPALLFALVSG